MNVSQASLNRAIDGWTGVWFPRSRRRTYLFGCWPLLFFVALWFAFKAAVWVAGMVLIGAWFGLAWLVSLATGSGRRKP